MADTGQPKVVKALFAFKGSNNDELCFSKGDVITVTQSLEGGWWEGTLGDKTGWFPSNYVKEIKADARAGMVSPLPDNKPEDQTINKRESMLFYHNVVLQSLIDSERTLVTELQTLLQNYLRPLSTANVLSGAEYVQLVGNLEEIASLHEALLAALDECAKLPVHQQRVGGIFMASAPQIKTLYHCYCANHPRAYAILQKRREMLCEFMESQGASNLMTLTTNLSKPFTRLEKYPSLLKELERHTDESHVDRGDTQRAISVYREIATSCMDIRKQKDLEFDVISSVKGWEGEIDLEELGESIMMSNVQVHYENGEKKELLLCLFPSVLVLLSVSQRMSGYMYEGKLPVNGIQVSSLEDSDKYKDAFELTGSLIERHVVACPSASEQTQWIEAIRAQAKLAPIYTPPTKPQSLQISSSQPSISTVTQAKVAHAFLQDAPNSALRTTWTMSCLRPSPPVRPSFFKSEETIKSPRVARKGSFRTKKPDRVFSEDSEYFLSRRIDDIKTLEDDAVLLKVIEAYCTSAKTRQTVNSSLFDAPHIILAEEEKIIVEETKGNQTIVEEKTLVDTVYSLRDSVKDLRMDQDKLRRDLEEEKRARKKLENLLRNTFKKGYIDGPCNNYDEGSPG